MAVWVEQISDEEGGGYRVVEDGREVWATHDLRQAEDMANRVQAGEFGGGRQTPAPRPTTPARPITQTPVTQSRTSNIDQAFGGVNFDPSLAFKVDMERLALESAKFEYGKTRDATGDQQLAQQRAQQAYTGVLSFFQDMANTFGIAPTWNEQQLGSLYAGLEGRGIGPSAGGGTAGGGALPPAQQAPGQAGGGGQTTGSAARAEIMKAAGGASWKPGTYGPGTPGWSNPYDTASDIVIANTYKDLTGKDLPGYTSPLSGAPLEPFTGFFKQRETTDLSNPATVYGRTQSGKIIGFETPEQWNAATGRAPWDTVQLDPNFNTQGMIPYSEWLRAGVRPMAQGGIVNQPTLALLGEQGPEVVAPLNYQDFMRYVKRPGDPTVYGATRGGQTIGFENPEQFFASGGARDWSNIQTDPTFDPSGHIGYSQWQNELNRPIGLTDPGWSAPGGMPERTGGGQFGIEPWQRIPTIEETIAGRGGGGGGLREPIPGGGGGIGGWGSRNTSGGSSNAPLPSGDQYWTGFPTTGSPAGLPQRGVGGGGIREPIPGGGAGIGGWLGGRSGGSGSNVSLPSGGGSPTGPFGALGPLMGQKTLEMLRFEADNAYRQSQLALQQAEMTGNQAYRMAALQMQQQAASAEAAYQQARITLERELGTAELSGVMNGGLTLGGRNFLMQSRANPDILGSIRASQGLPYTGVMPATAGLPGWEGMQPYYGQQSTPFVQAMAGLQGQQAQPGAQVQTRPVGQPMIEGQVTAGGGAQGAQGVWTGPESRWRHTGGGSFEPVRQGGAAAPTFASAPRGTASTGLSTGQAGGGIAADPRFAQLRSTPFIQDLEARGRQYGQGLGSDQALSLPSVNQIDYTTFQRMSPDEQAVTRSLYPGLTDTAFASPFVQAISSLGRRGTATRYA